MNKELHESSNGSYSKIQFLKDATENSKIVYLVLVKQRVFELLEFWKFGIAFLISTHKLKQKR